MPSEVTEYAFRPDLELEHAPNARYKVGVSATEQAKVARQRATGSA